LFASFYNTIGPVLVAARREFLEDYVPACTASSCPLPVFNQSEIIDMWMHELGAVKFDGIDGFTLISNSPSSVLAQLNVDSVLALDFVFAIDAESSGVLEVFVGDELVYSIEGEQLNGIGFIELLAYAGDQQITWRFNSGNPGATAQISSLRFYEVSIAVPEPNTTCIYVLAFLSLMGFRNRPLVRRTSRC